ncbi:MAG: hypothetical protein ACRDY7_16370, partial [Acidimicrobiia bacterium]
MFRAFRRRREVEALVTALPAGLEALAAGLRSGGTVRSGLEDWACLGGPLGADARAMAARLAAGERLDGALA